MSPRFCWFAVVLMVIASGCGQSDTPKPVTPSPKSPAPEPQAAARKNPDKATENPQPARPAKADFALPAVELCKEYKKDPVAANTKYKDKWIELSGTLGRMGCAASGKHYVTLEVSDPALDKNVDQPMCFMVEKEPWKTFAPPQQLKLMGKWLRVPGGQAYLAECAAVEVGRSGAPVLTVAQLVKEISADGEAAVEKYENQQIILSGGEIVGRKEGDKFGPPTEFELKGDGKIKITGTVAPGLDNSLFDAWKPGQKVDMLAARLYTSKGEMGFFCYPRGTPK